RRLTHNRIWTPPPSSTAPDALREHCTCSTLVARSPPGLRPLFSNSWLGAMAESVETIVIGGGQAGLAMSYHLTRAAHEHVVLERGRVAERWHSERWESLAFQFTNSLLRLPGHVYAGDAPDDFMGRDGVARFITDYAVRIAAPLRCGITVTSVRSTDQGRF